MIHALLRLKLECARAADALQVRADPSPNLELAIQEVRKHMTPVREMSAALKPCVMFSVAGHGSARPVRTQGHHRHPQELQKELTGAVDPQSEIMWLCGTCHDSIHAWLNHLLGREVEPPKPPARIVAEAQRVFDWYTLNKK